MDGKVQEAGWYLTGIHHEYYCSWGLTPEGRGRKFSEEMWLLVLQLGQQCVSRFDQALVVSESVTFSSSFFMKYYIYSHETKEGTIVDGSFFISVCLSVCPRNTRTYMTARYIYSYMQAPVGKSLTFLKTVPCKNPCWRFGAKNIHAWRSSSHSLESLDHKETRKHTL